MAHYDDEMGVFSLIEHHKSRGQRVAIIYLTSSDAAGGKNHCRKTVTRKALYSIGLDRHDLLYFVGEELKIPDLQLHHFMNPAFKKSLNIIEKIEKIDSIYTHAYEGGHPDHDASHVVTLAVAKELNLIKKCFQFPLYSGKNLPLSFFRFFLPLKENGTTILNVKKKRNFYIHLEIFLSFFWVQPKTISGLFLPFLVHTIFDQYQVLQGVNFKRIFERPHRGSLLYERRTKTSFKCFYKNVIKFFPHSLRPQPKT